ncbi:hypothetical protein [Paraburkholderia terrae]|uniref:Uncharacterized protein n=1 Tax=Paraburkholderia terrae TaxID=311230 RepID=A0ABM7TZ90_9BURK|nr:hypothetical protein [Paraburkholderia terrae]BCZ80305.1 hypothetical protein PTKU64_39800 [Paraburkholderia terrae]BDC41230.1 hypothetical protein PTKU15_45270 [Paraburkholderia terrae]
MKEKHRRAQMAHWAGAYMRTGSEDSLRYALELYNPETDHDFEWLQLPHDPKNAQAAAKTQWDYAGQIAVRVSTIWGFMVALPVLWYFGLNTTGCMAAVSSFFTVSFVAYWHNMRRA